MSPMGALDGLVVADFSRVLAGPYATMLLGDLGATVVKVERPGRGDDTRAWGPPYADNGQSTYFQSVNRNKLSIALDFTDPEDLAVARRIAEIADVLVENHKPGGLRRFGLDYDAVRRNNPGIVYCSISGFGPDSDLPGYDLLVQAMGGLMSVTGDEHPTKAGVAVVDVLTGLHATVAILAALNNGEGQQLQVSLLGSLLSSLVNQASAHVGAGQVPGLLGNAHPSIAPYEVFETADRPLVIAVGNDSQFRSLCQVLGLPELGTRLPKNADRVRERPQLKQALEARLAEHGAEHWRRQLSGVGVPCGPINNIAEAFALAESLGLNPVVPGSSQVSNPVAYSATPVTYRTDPPDVDADRGTVLALLRERG